MAAVGETVDVINRESSVIERRSDHLRVDLVRVDIRCFASGRFVRSYNTASHRSEIDHGRSSENPFWYFEFGSPSTATRRQDEWRSRRRNSA